MPSEVHELSPPVGEAQVTYAAAAVSLGTDGPVRRLMVIAEERISEWIEKGEVVERYYNPGDFFEEICLVLLNDDRPDPTGIQRMAGRAGVTVCNVELPRRLFLRTAGLRPRWLLRHLRPVSELARVFHPTIVRCYGAGINALAAREIKLALGVPYAVSVHINPDEDVRRRARGLRERVVTRMRQAAEREALRHADVAMPVYRSIVPYLERLGTRNIQVTYNVLNGSNLQRKTDYALHHPPRVIWVGRQFREKNPEAIVRAVGQVRDLHLTLVGDGPYHERTRQLAREVGIEHRISFERAMSNDELCERLPEYDLFAVHSEYWELSKAVLEALLTGLPVVINRRGGNSIPELSEDLCCYVAPTPEGYRAAFERLMRDDGERASLGRRAADQAEQRWSPERTEAAVLDLYRRLAGGRL